MKFLIDYKGKYFIIADSIDENEMSVGTIEDEEITDEFLKDHIELCQHYGIPPYIGYDENLEERINYLTEDDDNSGL